MAHEDKQSTLDIRELTDQSLQDYKENPIDLLNIGRAEQEYHYLLYHRDQYERTVRDIVEYVGDKTPPGSIRILEIGTFLGMVSVVLSRLGFKVVVTDIEESECVNTFETTRVRI